MSNNANYDGWLTKQEAAHVLQVAEKTIDRMADRSELQKATRKRPGLPPVVVFHPDDVERARRERNKPLPAFLVPSVGQVVDVSRETPVGPAPNMTVQPMSDPSKVPAVQSPSDMAEFLGAFARRSGPVPLWLNEEEAVRYSGLGIGHLRNAVTWRKIGPRGSLVCRRSDLDAL